MKLLQLSKKNIDMVTYIFNNKVDTYSSDVMAPLGLVSDKNKNYRHYADAIIDLHERGYCQDFVLFGNDLLWVQEKTFIRSNDFSILECHQFGHPGGQHEDLVILGILASVDNVRGILMNHYTYTSKIPKVIISKLSKMKSYPFKEISA
jgi:hypothetical protein